MAKEKKDVDVPFKLGYFIGSRATKLSKKTFKETFGMSDDEFAAVYSYCMPKYHGGIYDLSRYTDCCKPLTKDVPVEARPCFFN